jgi:hypothetical protein
VIAIERNQAVAGTLNGSKITGTQGCQRIALQLFRRTFTEILSCPGDLGLTLFPNQVAEF